jgi:hypothetical protein
LKYNQNNDGSWGSSASNINKIWESSWAILGLQNTIPTSEYVQDGEKWIYYNEPNLGWGSIEKDTIAFLAIKKKLKPYLKVTAKNYIEGVSEFRIENPTIYELKNLKLSLGSKIDEFCSYNVNLGDFSEGNVIYFNLTLNDDFFGKKSDDLVITGIDGKNQKVTLVTMPVTIRGDSPLVLADEDMNYSVADNSMLVEIGIFNKLPDLNLICSYLNPFSGIKESVDFVGGDNSLILNNLELLVGDFTFDLSCVADGIEFLMPVEFSVYKINRSFESSVRFVDLTTLDDFVIQVTNLNKDKQVFDFEVAGDFEGVIEPVEKSKIIAKNETRDIYFSVVDQDRFLSLGNLTSGYLGVRGDTGYFEKFDIIYSVNAKSLAGSSMFWYYWGVGLIVLVLGLLLVRRYRYLNSEDEEGINGQDDLILDDLDFD